MVIPVDTQQLKMKQKAQEIRLQEIEDEKRMVANEKNRDEVPPRDKALEETVHYIYASDFAQGTYRITTPGRYILMEDVQFNPNPGQTHSTKPNNDHTAWWPHEEQQDIYPGAGQYRDPYFMGFWAAITIETHDVLLDLNDHEIAMDPIFYYQQRWFTIIGLSTQYFLPGQVLYKK